MTSTVRMLSSLDVTPNTLEERLQELIDGVNDLDAAAADLGYDLRDLPRLLTELKHNDDDYHCGETVMEHIRWVMEDVEAVTAQMPEERRRLLRVVALLHDLGKAVTYAWDEKKGKATFHNHERKSVDIARVLLARYEEDAEGDLQQILDLVEHHDYFFKLGDARPSNGKVKYLWKFAEKDVSKGDQLQNLALFASADSSRSVTNAATLEEIRLVMVDLAQYRAQGVMDAVGKVLKARKMEANIAKYRDEIAALLDSAVPGLSAKLPDVKAANTELGKAKAYGVLKQVQAIIAR